MASIGGGSGGGGFAIGTTYTAGAPWFQANPSPPSVDPAIDDHTVLLKKNINTSWQSFQYKIHTAVLWCARQCDHDVEVLEHSEGAAFRFYLQEEAVIFKLHFV